MDHDFLSLMNRGAPLCTIQRLKLKFDKVLSNLGFKINLRRYTVVDSAAIAGIVDLLRAQGSWAGACTRPPVTST